MNIVSIQSSNKTTFFDISNSNSKKTEDFKNLLFSQNYDEVLEKTLAVLSDLEKEAHINTLKELEAKGFSKDELNTINIYAFLKKENLIYDLTLSLEEQKLVDNYDEIFNKIFELIKDKAEERLKLKPLQTNQMIIDTMLENFDLKDKKEPNKHEINLEI